MKPLHDDEFDWDDLAIGPSRVFKIALWSIIGLFVAVLAVLAFLAATEAHAHEAGPSYAQMQGYTPGPTAPSGQQPAGWTYPWSCCSGNDCKRVPTASVHETPGGYVVDGSKDDAPIGYHDKRVKDSPDGDYHWCAHQSGPDKDHTICLFRPVKGF